MQKGSKIYIAGHSGLVGSALERNLKDESYENLVLKSHNELDLTNQEQVTEFFKKEKPEYVFLAAAKVGGIGANMSYPAEFIYQNTQIQSNVIHSSWKNGVKKLLFFGSSCMYPKKCVQPMKEKDLFNGAPEPTNSAYAIAKRAGVKMCQAYNQQYKTNFISVIPTNLFGPNDNFDPNNSHLVAALIRKFHEAKINSKKEVILWGTGNPKREVLYVDDLANASVFLMQNYESSEAINIGTGKDRSIKNLAKIVKEIVGFEGEINFDISKSDGSMKKQLDTTKINSLGWEPKIETEEGIERTYGWFLEKIVDYNSL